jgi:hypothetical protein
VRFIYDEKWSEIHIWLQYEGSSAGIWEGHGGVDINMKISGNLRDSLLRDYPYKTEQYFKNS